VTQPIPTAVTTNGSMLALFVETLADYTAPTVAELTAGSVIDLTCYLTGDGLTTETTENNVEDPRLCSQQIYEARGDFTNTLELTYVFNPASPADDEARLGLPRGTAGYIAIRWAREHGLAVAADQEFDVYPVEMGEQRKQTPARNSVHRIMQKPFVVGEVARDAVVVA
jgi:hypothetical protein